LIPRLKCGPARLGETIRRTGYLSMNAGAWLPRRTRPGW
jgi:hypothetical protein